MADIQTYFGEILVRGNTKHIEEREYNKVRPIINKVLRNKKFKNLNVLLHINLQKIHLKRDNIHLNEWGYIYYKEYIYKYIIKQAQIHNLITE